MTLIALTTVCMSVNKISAVETLSREAHGGALRTVVRCREDSGCSYSNMAFLCLIRVVL